VRSALLFALVGFFACAIPAVDDSGKACTDTCPSGLACVDGRCGGVGSDAGHDAEQEAASDVVSLPDARDAETGARPCNAAADFGTPIAVAELNTTEEDIVSDLSPDELTIYIGTNHGVTGVHLFYSTRTSRTARWGPLVSLLPTGAYDDWSIGVSADGLTGILTSTRTGAQDDLYVVSRANTFSIFGSATPASAVNTSADEQTPKLSADSKTLFFDRTVGGNRELYMAPANGGSLGAPNAISELNTSALEAAAVPTADGLSLFFLSTRDPTPDGDIYVAHRPSVGARYDAPTRVPGVNGPGIDAPAWISPDGCTLYLSSTGAAGHYDIYVARKPL
jgi:hypothetical protein